MVRGGDELYEPAVHTSVATHRRVKNHGKLSKKVGYALYEVHERRRTHLLVLLFSSSNCIQQLTASKLKHHDLLLPRSKYGGSLKIGYSAEKRRNQEDQG